MLLRAKNTNVFETGLDDDLIEVSRQGKLAMGSSEAKDYFRKICNSLAQAKISKYDISSVNEGEIHVNCKFTIECGGADVKKSIRLLNNGAWVATLPKVIIKLEKDAATLAIVTKIAEEAARITRRSHYEENGEFKPIEERVMTQIKDALKDDLNSANERLINQIQTYFDSPDFRTEASKSFEDAIREQVHDALGEFLHVSPEAMHRFVDEIYCKKIHES